MTQQRRRHASVQARSGGGLSEAAAGRVTEWVGSGKGLTAAVAVVVVWAASGPLFGWSTTWQLVINTGTTIVTFLMVFLIQRTQNKDGLAIQLKLNELVAAMQGASNRLIEVEDLSEAELHVLRNITAHSCRWRVKIPTSPRRIRSKKPNRATPRSGAGSFRLLAEDCRSDQSAIRINASKSREPLQAGQRPGLTRRSLPKVNPQSLHRAGTTSIR